MKIKKIKSQGNFVYPATIAAAVKDANFLRENDIPMTLGEINLYFLLRMNSIDLDDSVSVSNQVYGVRHYYELASPSLLRIGNLDLHRTLPVQSLMRRCLVTDNGKVTYLDPNDSTLLESGGPAVLDGSAGLVMVEVPQHYRKHTTNTEEKYQDTEISLYPFEGAFKVNKFYISAFEATLDRTNLILSSVINTTPLFRGGNNLSAWDGTYRSLLGLPATAISLTNFRTYANNRGFYWKCLEMDIYTSIYWLYTVEYANLNCLLSFTKELTGDGFHKGGLGNGVTNMSSSMWSTYNGYCPFIPCGYTTSLGNKTGTKEFNFNAELLEAAGGAFSTLVPSYRGIENPFGHIWKWTDGTLAKGNGVTQDYYVCRNRTAYSSTITEDYELVGTSPTSGGWKKSILFGEYGDILTTLVGGGSSTYFSDYHWQGANDGTIYGFLSGGSADNGSLAGFGCLYSYGAPAYAYSNIGSRICYCDKNTILE